MSGTIFFYTRADSPPPGLTTAIFYANRLYGDSKTNLLFGAGTFPSANGRKPVGSWIRTRWTPSLFSATRHASQCSSWEFMTSSLEAIKACGNISVLRKLKFIQFVNKVLHVILHGRAKTNSVGVKSRALRMFQDQWTPERAHIASHRFIAITLQCGEHTSGGCQVKCCEIIRELACLENRIVKTPVAVIIKTFLCFSEFLRLKIFDSFFRKHH